MLIDMELGYCICELLDTQILNEEKEYFIMFTCGYGCMVYAEFLPDAIVLAKAAAIEKGYTLPMLESIRFPHGKTVLLGSPLNHEKETVPDYSGDL